MIGDVLRGTLLVVFIVCLAGAIAYVGDRVGHQVGRKRLSLFGIRPRYTSTIVAIGTGMLIALVVTLGALVASNSVKTAFFHLNAINERVTQLQAQADELEKHTRNEQVIVGVGDLMSPEYIVLRQNAPLGERLDRVRRYYNDIAAFVNATYVPRGLKKFSKPETQVNQLIRDKLGDVELTSALSESPVVMLAVADQNLFKGDEIHFELRAVRDVLIFPNGALIASFVVPANPANNVQFILAQLEQLVTQSAVRNGMPVYFAQNLQILGTRPVPATFQQELKGRGLYRITAQAAANVFPDMGRIPVIITLSPA